MSRKNILFIIILCFSFLAACGTSLEEGKVSRNASLKHVDLEEKIHQRFEQEITISAIGDMLIHSPVYDDARVGDTFDFSPMLKHVKPYLEKADITIANQETMIGGTEIGLSTYPSFNSPHEVGDALKDAGVDVVSIANNHTLDRGEEAIQRAIEHWEKIEMMYTGAYKDREDQENVRVYETEAGISVAFLSYTYGTNGISVPEGKDYLVNLIDKEQIANEVEKAKEKADVIILSLHFGNEYERLPNESQKDLVQYAADLGVHAVIGHHPHVLQPLEWVTGEKGNRMLAAYSLGNFLSNQQKLYQRIGGILTFSVKKITEGDSIQIEVHSPEFLPTYVKFHPSWSDYQVVPMFQLTDNDLPDAQNHYDEIKTHMSQWITDLTFIEE